MSQAATQSTAIAHTPVSNAACHFLHHVAAQQFVNAVFNLGVSHGSADPHLPFMG